MNKTEKQKLAVLLDYWVKHNKEHGEEFREWAKKAGDSGQVSVRDSILRAANLINEANESLFKALEALKT